MAELYMTATCPGYETQEVLLRANDTECQIVLEPNTKRPVFGRVVDLTTGERIARFRLTIGWVLKEKWLDVPCFDVPIHGIIPKVYDFGSFSDFLPTNGTVMLKFEADGYLPFFSRAFAPEDSAVDLSIAMKPSRLSRIPVVSVQGSPVRGISIYLQKASRNGASVVVTPDGIDSAYHSEASPRAITKLVADGRGTIPRDWDTDASVIKLIAISGEGYAFASPSEVDQAGELRLKPWSRVEGTLPNQETGWNVFALSRQETSPPERPTGLMFRVPMALCDNQGRFTLPQMPSGPCNLGFVRITIASDGTTNRIASGQMTVQVGYGETTDVVVESLPIPTIP